MVKPGKLDQLITFQVATSTSDDGGGRVVSWANLADNARVWAHVRSNAGREAFEEDRNTAVSTTTFWVRNRSDIDERNAIIYGGERYNIRHVLREGGRALYLKIIAERGVSSQGAV